LGSSCAPSKLSVPHSNVALLSEVRVGISGLVLDLDIERPLRNSPNSQMRLGGPAVAMHPLAQNVVLVDRPVVGNRWSIRRGAD
jgi:hypothetical protein